MTVSYANLLHALGTDTPTPGQDILLRQAVTYNRLAKHSLREGKPEQYDKYAKALRTVLNLLGLLKQEKQKKKDELKELFNANKRPIKIKSKKTA